MDKPEAIAERLSRRPILVEHLQEVLRAALLVAAEGGVTRYEGDGRDSLVEGQLLNKKTLVSSRRLNDLRWRLEEAGLEWVEVRDPGWHEALEEGEHGDRARKALRDFRKRMRAE